MMPDRERVIKAFEFCLMPPNREEIENHVCSHEDCPYYREYNGGKCISAAASDALALLKVQEPVKPIIETTYGTAECDDPWGRLIFCGACGKRINEKYNPDEDDKYCKHCGKPVKWG